MTCTRTPAPASNGPSAQATTAGAQAPINPTVAGNVYGHTEYGDGYHDDIMVTSIFSPFVGGHELRKIVISIRAFTEEDKSAYYSSSTSMCADYV